MGVIAQQLAKNNDAPATVPAPVTPVVSRSKAQRFKDIAKLSTAQDAKHETVNTFVRLGSRVGIRLPSISTGCPTVDDYVIGCGGFPRGRVIELFGPESSGKTTVALHVVGECQRAGGLAAFVDAEHALDPTYASKIIGVNVDELVINQPDSGEEALRNVDALLGLVDIIVIDSVSALVPRAELDGEIGDVHMGLQARMMSQAMRILVGKANKSGTTLVFINQIREKIGGYGNPETTSGGRALKFAASVRLDVRRISKAIMDGTTLLGHDIKLKAVKNKCGVPFRETLIRLMYDSGIDKTGDIIDFAEKKGVLERSGAWYSFAGERVANGLDNTKERLKADPALLAKVHTALTAALAAENTKADAKE
jgi:recombination protein RecA